MKDTYHTDADLNLTESDEDGQPIEKLDSKALDQNFIRKVGVHVYDGEKTPQLVPPKGTITSGLLHTDKSKLIGTQVDATNVQKCVFPVYIEDKWQFQGSGSNFDLFNQWWDDGSTLKIHPIAIHNNIKDGKKDLDGCVLTVSRKGAKFHKTDLTGNSPVLVSDGIVPTKDLRKRKDFIFGVFIDGTMNNKYNTQARITWENNRILAINQKGDTESSANHLKVYATSAEQVGKNNYIYKETSYENDLSNPAILHKNYDDDNVKIFKVYTEGIATNTLADEKEVVQSYETDAAKIGGGLDFGSSGIIHRVTRAIEQMTDKIIANIAGNETIRILTVDVFGFSRGSAACRHFVDEITLPAYWANTNNMVTDRNDRRVNNKYFDEPLPTNGYLGYLLTEKQITFDRMEIRFAGLFDSVAHHGFVQWNDIADLGLNSILKAKHIVHMTAGDEHRCNFSLTRIPRGKNHIELNMPGVHCDVGGSYVEGKPEGNVPGLPPDQDGKHILAEDYASYINGSAKLEKFRGTLIQEGWFLEKQIKINSNIDDRHKKDHHKINVGELSETAYFTLETQRAYLSNQYSYIPLHMMCQYAIDQGLPLILDKVKKNEKF